MYSHFRKKKPQIIHSDVCGFLGLIYEGELNFSYATASLFLTTVPSARFMLERTTRGILNL
ncbi:MAG: hypothetical protein IJE27_02655, partial [Anaerotignum sp.]|nr:hypothetical protein [Anaerotignum sp.]